MTPAQAPGAQHVVFVFVSGFQGLSRKIPGGGVWKHTAEAGAAVAGASRRGRRGHARARAAGGAGAGAVGEGRRRRARHSVVEISVGMRARTRRHATARRTHMPAAAEQRAKCAMLCARMCVCAVKGISQVYLNCLRALGRKFIRVSKTLCRCRTYILRTIFILSEG